MISFSMISVIVATYNQEKTIARTLDSILSQKCHLPVEIVIGEDCSTDNTRSICEAYAIRNPQIRLICNQHNKGLVDNYFDCLLTCKGELIADCAGDDFWVDNKKLEKELRIMESDNSITLVHTAWQSYNERNNTATVSPQQPFSAPITNGKSMIEAIITQTRMPVIQLCTSLYRADVILKEYQAYPQLFRGSEIVCEDLQIAFFEALNGKIAYLPDITLYYSQGENTISAPKDIRKQFDFYKKATNQSFAIANTFGIKSVATKQFFSKRVFALMMHGFRSHDKKMYCEAIDCQKRWGVKNNFAILIAKGATSYEPIWNFAITLRRYLLKFKKVSR